MVDLAAARCPPLTLSDTAPFQARVSRPVPDMTSPDGKRWVSAAALQEGIDTRDLVIARMSRAGKSLAQSYAVCRGDAAPVADGRQPQAHVKAASLP